MRTRTRPSNDIPSTISDHRVGWGFRSRVMTVVAAFTLLIPTAAWAGSMTEGDFADPTVWDFDGLGLPFVNWEPVVIDDNTITSDTGAVRYMDMGLGNCITNECVGSHSDNGYLDIVLGEPMRRVGMWVGVSAATVEFYGEDDSQLGSVAVTPVTNQAMEFAGWEADAGLIGRIRVIDNETNSMVVTVDNLMVEDSSAPTTGQQVTIDIRPGSAKNSVNLSGRVVPVAIHTTPSFDASSVDPLTVTLAGASVRMRGNGDPSSTLADVDGDGDRDLLLHIEVRDMTLAAGDVEATLHGLTLSGDPFEGTDIIRIVP